MKFIDLISQRFGALVVVALASRNPVKWNCQCDCGGPIKSILAHNLKSTYSCGCMKKDLISKQNTKHGQRKTKATKTYKTWAAMLTRTNNSDPNYGGRGICVSDSWKDFNNFFNDLGEIPPGYSIERIDVNGNYCKENCTLIPIGKQAKNRTTSIMIVVDTHWVPLSEYCEKNALPYKKTYDKYRSYIRYRNMSQTEAITLALGFSTDIKNQKV
jgi:hypothetical protein